MVILILVWTCVAIFVATAYITIMSIVGKIEMDKKYRDKLFYLLIIEIASISVLGFKNFLDQKEVKVKKETVVREGPAIIRITNINNTNYNYEPGKAYKLAGITTKLPGDVLKGELHIGELVYTLYDIYTDNRNHLSAEYKIDDSYPSATDAAFVLYLYRDKKLIDSDTVYCSYSLYPSTTDQSYYNPGNTQMYEDYDPNANNNYQESF